MGSLRVQGYYIRKDSQTLVDGPRMTTFSHQLAFRADIYLLPTISDNCMSFSIFILDSGACTPATFCPSCGGALSKGQGHTERRQTVSWKHAGCSQRDSKGHVVLIALIKSDSAVPHCLITLQLKHETQSFDYHMRSKGENQG